MERKPIGQLLREAGYISDEHISFALKEQKATKERIGEVLIRIGIITDFEIAKAISEQSKLPFLDVRSLIPSSTALSRIPVKFARERTILPFAVEDGLIQIALSDPFDRPLLESIINFVGTRFRAWVAPANELKKTVEWHYYFLEHPVDKDIERVQQILANNPMEDISIDELINNLFILAIVNRATDVHISPTSVTSRIFYRIDGLLELAFVFPASIHGRLINAIKARSGMDIAERRLPQDGRMNFNFLGESYDLRISTVQSTFGENMVVRILPVRSTVLHLSSLGFDKRKVSAIESLFKKPYGMVLVAGPTGSGKTTTLHSALRLLDVIHLNILSVEDPVEYNFSLIKQTQAAEEIGYNFAAAIRHFLRQDPDVIFVGEIRDEETAKMAVRAALTGHLLLSTIHANDAVSSIPRLKDLGISGELLASTFLGTTAQRLVRTNCFNCKEPYRPEPQLLKKFGLPAEVEYLRGKGCQYCRGRGYVGRTALAEILVVSETLQKLIADNAPITTIMEALSRENFKTLKEDAKEKILAGVTTVEECNRVLG
ncbi:MAG: GspE/PulE family protein [Syntrophobacterales bacterium]|nr:GspE/PulE family protein [Syntrophobacterales bacterium]